MLHPVEKFNLFTAFSKLTFGPQLSPCFSLIEFAIKGWIGKRSTWVRHYINISEPGMAWLLHEQRCPSWRHVGLSQQRSFYFGCIPHVETYGRTGTCGATSRLPNCPTASSSLMQQCTQHFQFFALCLNVGGKIMWKKTSNVTFNI